MPQSIQFVKNLKEKFGSSGIIDFFLNCDYGEEVQNTLLKNALAADRSRDDDADEFLSDFENEGIHSFFSGEGAFCYRQVGDNWVRVVFDDISYDGVKITFVEQKGGYEGQGEDAHTIFKLVFQDGEIGFLRVDYSYFSYDGCQFDYCSINAAEPQNVVVVQYNPIA